MSRILKQLASLNPMDAVAEPSGGTAVATDAPDAPSPPPAVLGEFGDEALAALAERVLALKPVAAQNVAELGTLLKAIKSRVGHGSFVAWLADVAGMTRSTATKYMRAAELSNIDVLEPLGVEKLYILRVLPTISELTPESTLPVPPKQNEIALRDMSTRDLRAAVQALAPSRPARRSLRRDLVQRYVHLRDELTQIVQQLNIDTATSARFERTTGHSPDTAAEIVARLP